MKTHKNVIEWEIGDIDRRYVGNGCSFGGVIHTPMVRKDPLTGKRRIVPACGQGGLWELRPRKHGRACVKCRQSVKRFSLDSYEIKNEPLSGIDELLTLELRV